MFLSGFALLGLQFGVNATSALIYPTSFRADGSGWTFAMGKFAMGKFGSVTGSIVAGYLIAMKLPIQHLYLLLAVPLTIVTIAAFTLARLYSLRFKGMGLYRPEAVEGRPERPCGMGWVAPDRLS